MTTFNDLPIEVILPIIHLSIADLPVILCIPEVLQRLKPFLQFVKDYEHSPIGIDFLRDINPIELSDLCVDKGENAKKRRKLNLSSSTILYLDLHNPEVSLEYLMNSELPSKVQDSMFICLRDCSVCEKQYHSCTEEQDQATLTIYDPPTFTGRGINLDTLDSLVQPCQFFHIELDKFNIPYSNGSFTKRILENCTLRKLYMYESDTGYNFNTTSIFRNSQVVANNPTLDFLIFKELTHICFDNFKDYKFLKYIHNRAACNVKIIKLRYTKPIQSTINAFSGFQMDKLVTLSLKNILSIQNLTLPNLETLNYEMSSGYDSRRIQYHYLPSRSPKPQTYDFQFINCPRLKNINFKCGKLPRILHCQIPKYTKVEINKTRIESSSILGFSHFDP